MQRKLIVVCGECDVAQSAVIFINNACRRSSVCLALPSGRSPGQQLAPYYSENGHVLLCLTYIHRPSARRSYAATCLSISRLCGKRANVDKQAKDMPAAFKRRTRLAEEGGGVGGGENDSSPALMSVKIPERAGCNISPSKLWLCLGDIAATTPTESSGHIIYSSNPSHTAVSLTTLPRPWIQLRFNTATTQL